MEFNDPSRTSPKIQGLFKTVGTLMDGRKKQEVLETNCSVLRNDTLMQ